MHDTGRNPAKAYEGQSAALHSYGSYLLSCLPRFIQQFAIYKDELTLFVPPSGVVPVLTFLRDHHACAFKSVMDIAGVDYPERAKRFEVVYNLLSHRHNARIRVKTYADESSPVPSATSVFRGADWSIPFSCSFSFTYIDALVGTKEKPGTCLAFSSPTTRISVASSQITVCSPLCPYIQIY